MTESQREQLRSGAAVWNLTLSSATLERFDRFATLLEDANRQFNLTRVAPEDVVTLHFLDSLALASVWRPRAGDRLLDVGTGAGFPGMPLALVFPELDVTLLDGTRKRLAFLDSVIAELQLTNVRTLHGRAEEIARLPIHRAHYDVVTARAVARLPELAPWLLPLVKPGGLAVAYKSRDIAEELAAARPVLAALQATLDTDVEVALPASEIVRRLILLRADKTVHAKVHRTPR